MDEHGVYLFMGFLVLFFAFCAWLVFCWQRKPVRNCPVPYPVARGAILFNPPPKGLQYDPEATIADSLSPPLPSPRSEDPMDF